MLLFVGNGLQEWLEQAVLQQKLCESTMLLRIMPRERIMSQNCMLGVLAS
jgi:hypothetical protein